MIRQLKDIHGHSADACAGGVQVELKPLAEKRSRTTTPEASNAVSGVAAGGMDAGTEEGKSAAALPSVIGSSAPLDFFRRLRLFDSNVMRSMLFIKSFNHGFHG